MKQRKFRSATAAARFGAVTGYRAVRKAKTKLKDGTPAYWYSFVKMKKARSKARYVKGKRKYGPYR